MIFSSITLPLLLTKTIAQTSEIQRQKAEKLINILESNNKTIETAFIRLSSQNISLKKAQNLYQIGLTEFNEAINFMNQEKYNQSCTLSIQAMQNFKATLKEIEMNLSLEKTPIEITAEELTDLKANITRTYNYVERLENLTRKSASLGYNTFSIEKQLTEIKQNLRNATTELLSFNIDDAKKNLVTARTMLKELLEPISQLTNFVNEINTRNYLEAAEKRVSSIKENITLSTVLTPQVKEEAITALNNSEMNLENARIMIDNKNVNEAIQQLEEAKKWEEESIRLTNLVFSTSNSVVQKDETITQP